MRRYIGQRALVGASAARRRRAGRRRRRRRCCGPAGRRRRRPDGSARPAPASAGRGRPARHRRCGRRRRRSASAVCVAPVRLRRSCGFSSTITLRPDVLQLHEARLRELLDEVEERRGAVVALRERRVELQQRALEQAGLRRDLAVGENLQRAPHERERLRDRRRWPRRPASAGPLLAAGFRTPARFS